MDRYDAMPTLKDMIGHAEDILLSVLLFFSGATAGVENHERLTVRLAMIGDATFLRGEQVDNAPQGCRR